MASSTIFCVLFADFGVQEHCFTPLRERFQVEKRKFFDLTEDDRRELKELDLAQKLAMRPK
jgi:hypothetical protein